LQPSHRQGKASGRIDWPMIQRSCRFRSDSGVCSCVRLLCTKACAQPPMVTDLVMAQARSVVALLTDQTITRQSKPLGIHARVAFTAAARRHSSAWFCDRAEVVGRGFRAPQNSMPSTGGRRAPGLVANPALPADGAWPRFLAPCPARPTDASLCRNSVGAASPHDKVRRSDHRIHCPVEGSPVLPG